jgi:hypothetical protein
MNGILVLRKACLNPQGNQKGGRIPLGARPMPFRLNKTEIECVQRLADMFEQGNIYLTADFVGEEGELNASPERRAAILATMETMGLLADVTHGDQVRYFSFTITPKAVLLAREIKAMQEKESEPGDVVEQITISARKRPIIAYAIVAFFVLTAAVTLINQALQILQNLGWIPKP